MVADKVEVISKKAGEGKTYHWISDGSNGYTIEEIGDIGVDGTRIICHLKEDCVEKFTDKYNIENAIKTNSNYIETPIYLALNDEKSDKQINSKKAIWNKAKSEISTEEYKEFYNQISHLPGDQFMTCHYKLEGDINFNALLFIPGMKPFDLFHPDMMTRIQLYTKSVRIGSSDENSSLNLVPRYLRFLRGVVDCNDIPLNVSRETLQDSSIIAKIKNLIIKKIINELTNKKENELEEYKKFWNNFGAVLLEGLCEYSPDRDSILKLCLFESYKSSGNLLSIDNYIQSMPEGQDKIYYLIGEDINDMVNSPQLEGFKKKNIDVLLLNKPVDRFWVTAYNNYGGKNFQSITNSEINLDKINNNDDKKEVDSIENQEICTAFKKVFDGLVKDVKVSKRLLDSPMCLSVEEGSIDIQMEKFLKEQGQLRESQSSAMIVEINTDHIIIKNIYNQLKENSENANAKNKAKILLELSYLSQGILPKHPNEFTKSIISLIG
jgi:molecular chaperone HtpG